MRIRGKSSNEFNEQDLYTLIDDEVAESIFLEFKRELDLETGDKRKEFLYDISAMANTHGGVILFGIEEKKDSQNHNTGIAGAIVDLNIPNTELIQNRIENLVRDNLDPKFIGLDFNWIRTTKGTVLVLGIGRSFQKPHMVTLNSSNKFYKRRTGGKYLLDADELRNEFLFADRVLTQIAQFRQERIEHVVKQDFHSNVDVNASFFLHIVPLGHINETSVDLSNVMNVEKIRSKLKPPLSDNGGHRHILNLDGLMTYVHNGPIVGYAQLFRNGSLEFYSSQCHIQRPTATSIFDIDGYVFEEISLEAIESARAVYSSLDLLAPYAAMITLTRTKGARVLAEGPRHADGPIQVNRILFPSLLLSDLSNAHTSLRPVFDMLWQAANSFGSPNYDAHGNRKRAL